MQILRFTDEETPAWDAAACIFPGPLGEADAHSSLSTTDAQQSLILFLNVFCPF